MKFIDHNYSLSNTDLFQLDLEHRLVYKVIENRVYFLQARYHYQFID